MRQLSKSKKHFDSFKDDIMSDFLSSRYEKNEYSKELKGSSKENRKDRAKIIDLSTGHYSQYLLKEQPTPPTLGSHDIAIHLLALFYRSVDERLPPAKRKHGLDTVKRAFEKLEFWMSNWEDWKKSNSNSSSLEISGEGLSKGPKKRMRRKENKRKYRESFDKDGENTEMRTEKSNTKKSPQQGPNGSEDRSSKRMRKDPPELSSEGDGKNNERQSGPTTENSTKRSSGNEDEAGRRMRKDPPELIDKGGRKTAEIIHGRGKVFLPPRPQDGGGSMNNDQEENKSSENSKKKDNPIETQVPQKEPRNEKAPYLPPQNKVGPNLDMMEKEKSIDSNARSENSTQRSGGSEDGHKKGVRKIPPGMRGKFGAVASAETSQRSGKVLLPPKPSGNDDNEGSQSSEKAEEKDTHHVSKVPGIEPRTEKASVSHTHQHGMDRSMAEKEKASDRSAQLTSTQRKNRNDADSAELGSTGTLQKKPRDKQDESRSGGRKDPPEQIQNDTGTSKTSRSRASSEKRFVPPHSQHATISAATATAHHQGLDATQNSAQPKELPQLEKNKTGVSKVSEREQKTGQTVLPSQKHDVELRKRAITMTDERQDAMMNQPTAAAKSSKVNPAVTLASAKGTVSEKSSRGDGPSIPDNREKDDHNVSHSTKNVADVSARSSEHQNEPHPDTLGSSARKEIDDDVIDLTCDSPPTCPLEAASKAPSTPQKVIKQNTDEENTESNKPSATAKVLTPICAKPIKKSIPPRPPSPPASPPPPAIIHNPPPPPRPKPETFSKMQTILFNADPIPTRSGSLAGRPSCGVSYDTGYHLDGSGSCMDDATCISVKTRLLQWDPYWKIVEELGAQNVKAARPQVDVGMTNVGTRTSSCVSVLKRPAHPGDPSSCAAMFIDLPKEVWKSKCSNRDSSGKLLAAGYRPWGVKWGKLSHPYTDDKNRVRDRFQTGDRRLIVRTLPLVRTSKDRKKRADGHLWPKGTFLQLKRDGAADKLLSISQRKQQSHDHTEWKGMSHSLDLTKEVIDTKVPINIKLCSKEVVENVNWKLMGSYALHAAICEYVEPDDLYNQLMGKVEGGDVTLPRISLRSARKMAKDHLADSMVSIVDSDDESSSANDQGKNLDSTSLTFSLLCSMSKKAMETPVRGRHCKHMQCFDLRNFLHTNKNITGGRWRCGVCEDFVHVRDLVHCGLFQAMLDAFHGKVSGARDRVSYRADGTWKLMDENRLRYGSKRGGGTTANASTAETNASKQEVIELL